MTQKKKKSVRRKQPTLAQVGEIAGVDSSTVSQVLNNKDNCWASEATRKRIFDAAKELGYRPNLAARSLRSGKTHNLGLIMTSCEPRRINGFEEAAYQEGLVAMMSFNPNDPEQEDRLIQNHIDRGIDGLVIYPCDGGEHKELRELAQSGFPVVAFDGSYLLDFDCDSAEPDYPAAGRMQAEHLLSQKRKHILIADAYPEATVNAIRNRAIAERLEASGAEVMRMGLSQPTGRLAPEEEDIYPQILDFMQRHKGEFDGLISYDSIAALCLRALLSCGVSVPGDVAIVGAGNSMVANHSVIPITSIDTSDYLIGGEAFNLLKQRQQDNDAPVESYISPARLIPRASSFQAAITPASITSA